MCSITDISGITAAVLLRSATLLACFILLSLALFIKAGGVERHQASQAQGPLSSCDADITIWKKKLACRTLSLPALQSAVIHFEWPGPGLCQRRKLPRTWLCQVRHRSLVQMAQVAQFSPLIRTENFQCLRYFIQLQRTWNKTRQCCCRPWCGQTYSGSYLIERLLAEGGPDLS